MGSIQALGLRPWALALCLYVIFRARFINARPLNYECSLKGLNFQVMRYLSLTLMVFAVKSVTEAPVAFSISSARSPALPLYMISSTALPLP